MVAESHGSRRHWLALSCLVALAATLWMGASLAGGSQWGADVAVREALQATRSPALDALMIAVSYIGFTFPFLPLVVLVGLALWVARGRDEAALVLLGTAGSSGLGYFLRELVRRPRPPVDAAWLDDRLSPFGFPSMHVVEYTAFFGLLCYLAATRWRGLPYRWPVLVVGVLAIALVGPSRIYLNAHWPTDVLAGYLLGYAGVVLSIAIYRRWLGIGQRRNGG